MTKRITLLTAFLAIFFTLSLDAQVKSVQKEAERQGTNRINRKIDEGIDSGFDKIEEGIGSLFGKKKKKKKKGQPEQVNASYQTQSQQTSSPRGSISVAGQDPDALFKEYGMYPPNNASDVTVPVTLKWTPMNGNGFKASSYELYLEEGETNPMQMLGVARSTKYECKDLKPNTTYSWSYKGKSSQGQYMPGGGGTFTTGAAGASKVDVQWNRFDFVPGDEVIFSDGPDIMEENGEFPSRWDLVEGNCEIINVNGENVIVFPKGGEIIPYLKNSKDDYLPDVFTVELDAWFYTDTNQRNLYIYFFDKKNQSNDLYQSVEINSFSAEFENSYQEVKREKHNGMWRHISIAYTKGKLKVYLDETRLINVPRMEGNPTGLTFNFSGYSGDEPDELQYIKNVRIAKGGVKYYDRVMQDGKIICNGIRFDVNKATLKPESMGPINKIYELMNKKPDLNFSVEGHTDADGDDANNQKLSEQRAKSVMEQLISMGISPNRLTSTGFGESKPIDNNSTPEGKANNRRVEFVKFTGTASNAAPTKTVSSAWGPAPTKKAGGNPAYDKITAQNIDTEFDKLQDEMYTAISGPNGMVNGPGTIFLFFTSDRNLGKMEILDVDKNDNYKTTIRYATYNRSRETVSESEYLEIPGTAPFDLDKGSATDVPRAECDFLLKRNDAKSTSFGLGNEGVVIRKYE